MKPTGLIINPKIVCHVESWLEIGKRIMGGFEVVYVIDLEGFGRFYHEGYITEDDLAKAKEFEESKIHADSGGLKYS